MLNSILNLVFPTPCILCDALLTDRKTGAICASCEARLTIQGPPLCGRCGFPAPSIRNQCGACRSGATRYDFGRSALGFGEDVRTLVHHFKYGDRVSLARPLGRALRRCLENESGFRADFAIPVPLHPRQERRRGYNQATLLAEGLGLPVCVDVIRRRRNTNTQTGLSRSERTLNVRGAFGFRRPIQGCGVIVDDVQTTGATVNELARTLRRAGASRVEVLTLARVGTDG